MADRISFGMKGMSLFPLTGIAGGVPTYGTPVIWGGLKGGGYKSKSESEQIYADDMVWATIKGLAGGDFDVTHVSIPLEILKLAFGVALDAKKARIYGATSNKSVGACFETTVVDEKGETTNELHIFYNLVFGDTERSFETKEDKTKVQEFKSTATASAVEIKGFSEPVAYVVLRKSEVGEDVYNKAKGTMYIPTTI